MVEICPKAVGGAKHVNSSKGHDKMLFKPGNGTFRGIDAVVVQWDQLNVHLVGSNVHLNCFGALVVHHVQCWLVVVLSTENCKHFGEDGGEQGVSTGWHWLHDDCIKVVDVCNKDTLHVLE